MSDDSSAPTRVRTTSCSAIRRTRSTPRSSRRSRATSRACSPTTACSCSRRARRRSRSSRSSSARRAATAQHALRSSTASGHCYFPGNVRPRHQRAHRRDQALGRDLRPRRHRSRQRAAAQEADVHARRTRRLPQRCIGRRRERRDRRLLGPRRRVRAEVGREGDRQGPARDLRLRGGVPDEPAEPHARARDRDGLRDGEPERVVRLFERREGDRRLRRERRRAGSGRSRAPVQATAPRRKTRHSRESPGVTARSMTAVRSARVDWLPMDVLVLIDKLDDLVHQAKAVPLTDQVRIDREEIYDILDQMRATIPEEIKQARWIVKERQEMLAEAKRECDRVLQEAREQAVREASQTEIVKLAEKQAQEIVDDSRRQARETKLEMEDWADGILSTLEVNLDKFLGTVKRGRERLQERSQESVVAGVGADDDDGY